jgi:hypothetical protein
MTTLGRMSQRLLAAALSAALVLVLLPATAGAAARHTVELADRGDFVAQTNNVQCVGASMQMMLNMIEPGRDRSAKTQLRLQNLARSWSGRRPDNIQRRGASVRGWAAGLNIEGAGPYKLVGLDTIEQAMHTAAKAIATTGKPVGLLVWRGRHAWVMSGFTATADPTATDRFTVTRAIIHDPLYPHGSSVWGPSPRPGQALTIEALGKQYRPRRNRTFTYGTAGIVPSNLGGKYVLVLPYQTDFEALAASTR